MIIIIRCLTSVLKNALKKGADICRQCACCFCGDHRKQSAALVLALASWLLSASTLAASDKVQVPFKIAFNDFPPYAIDGGVDIPAYQGGNCTYPDHKGYGIDPDFLKLALKHAGIEHELVFYPFARVQLMLSKGIVDASAGLFYSEIDNHPKYQYILYDLGGATLFYAKKELAPSITRLDQIASLKLGIVRKESFHNEVLDGAIYETKSVKPLLFANNYRQLFKQLEADRVDVIAVNNVVGDYVMKLENIKNVTASPLRLPYGDDPVADGIYIALGKHVPKSLYNHLKQSVDALKQEGAFRCIQKKYGVDSNY